MTSTRTDIHRPSAPEFDPQAYDCYGVFDTCTDPLKGGGSQAERLALVNILRDKGYTFGPGSSNQCGHCGAFIRYCALMVREDVKQFIYVGETCLDGRFEMTKAEFDKLRKAAQLDREAQRLLVAFTEECDKHQGLAYASYADNIQVSAGVKADWALGTMADIARKARRYGSVFDKQVVLIERLLTELADKEAQAALARLTPAAPKAELKVTGARQLIEGTVVSRKDEENPFSYHGGTIWKILVEQADGSRVWGTEPSKFVTGKGDKVRFMAAVKVSDKDASFGFFSRPTQFEITEEAVQA